MRYPAPFLAGLLALSGLTEAAWAAGRFAPPAGCTAYMTVQSRGCLVSHYYTCQADPEGHRWRVDLDATGLIYAGRIDAETQWIESQDISDGDVVTRFLDLPAREPASFSELLSTGRDEYDFTTSGPFVGSRNYKGFDRLTGQSLVVDGQSLLETEFGAEVTGSNGQPLWRVEGREYISRDLRIFFGGISEVITNDGERIRNDRTPMSFAWPEEDGFLTLRPRYGCDPIMSGLSLDEGAQG